jgi:hypothetical protein
LPSSKVYDEGLADYMDYAALILDTLETMNLVQRAGHGLSKSSAMSRLDANAIDVTNTNHSNHKCYSMHESVSLNNYDTWKCFAITNRTHHIFLMTTDKGYCRRHVKAENIGLRSTI